MQTHEVVDHFFRHESAKVTSYLTVKFGTKHLEQVEDAVQDTLLKAMQTWPFKGIPTNPSGWILASAKNRLLDILKLRVNSTSVSTCEEELDKFVGDSEPASIELEEKLTDDLLSMMFACCQPALSKEFQIILTLKILCGFGKREISKALLKSEEATAKSYTRARAKFKAENIQLSVPIGKHLNDRLDNVLKVIYLLFNEGYHSHHEEMLIRKDVCAEAMRLTNVLLEHSKLKKPNVHALMALMSFQSSRIPSRLNQTGELVILEHQDRTLWSEELINLGLYHIEKSVAFGITGEYHLQAGIAAVHCTAKTYEETNWRRILLLYDKLLELKPNEIVALNRIVAFGKVHGPKKALKELDLISHNKTLLKHHLFFSIKATLYLEAGNRSVALEYFNTALEMTANKVERAFILKRMGKSG